jgi:ankyrin repeat protein
MLLITSCSVHMLLNVRSKRRGNTPLHVAAIHAQSTEIIGCLVAAGGDVNAVTFTGRTPLMYSQNVETAQLLLEAGAAVNARCSLGSTVLHIAAEQGMSAGVICCLLKAGADATAADTLGSTPAEVSAAWGRSGAAALLQRVEADQRSKQQQQTVTAALPPDLQILVHSRGWRRSNDTLQRKIMLQRLAATAACAERSDRVELLQRAEFALYAHAATSRAYFATEAGFAMAQVLRAVPQAGANKSQWRQRRLDLQAANDLPLQALGTEAGELSAAGSCAGLAAAAAAAAAAERSAALPHAERPVATDTEQMPKPYTNLQAVRLLVASGGTAPVNVHSTRTACTPLLLALAARRSPELVKFLIDSGADVNRQSYVKEAPLTLALELPLLRLLLNTGAHVNAMSADGSTALHKAAEQGCSAGVICCLLKAGADATAADNEGLNAAAVAAKSGHTATAALLQRAADDQRSKQHQQTAAVTPPVRLILLPLSSGRFTSSACDSWRSDVPDMPVRK